MGQLLGSTNKAEVLESMEFFRVAWEYQFDSAEVSNILSLPRSHIFLLTHAQVGIKKMLHLIWSKDNNSSSTAATAAATAMAGEDGKELNLKGVRARLLECYRSLYFDPLPDMEPRQQVNRIAKNMIELRPCFLLPQFFIYSFDEPG